MTTRIQANRIVPWYQEPYVWLCISFPLASVIVGVSMAVIAFRGYDGVVVDDYYKQGLGINRVLERDQQAQAMGLSADFDYDNATRTLTVHIHGGEDDSLPDTLLVRFLHATRGGQDQQVSLDRTPSGDWFGVVPPLAEGHYHLHLEGADWRLTGEVFE
jgi:uncharacterized protein